MANFLGEAIGLDERGRGAGLIGPTLGAILSLWIYRLIRGRKQARACDMG